jgi:hypothetical protein
MQMMNPATWPGSLLTAPVAAQPITDVFSSDPPDDVAPNLYPTISQFLSLLDSQHPQCMLARYIDTFGAADFYNISSLTTQELMGPGFYLSVGNASFLLKEVKKEMKRADKVRGKKRRVEVTS